MISKLYLCSLDGKHEVSESEADLSELHGFLTLHSPVSGQCNESQMSPSMLAKAFLHYEEELQNDDSGNQSQRFSHVFLYMVYSFWFYV